MTTQEMSEAPNVEQWRDKKRYLWLMGLIALMLLLYLVAPSAQQIVNLARLRAGGKP